MAILGYMKTQATPYRKRARRLAIKPGLGSLKAVDRLPFYSPEGLKARDVDQALREERRERSLETYRNSSGACQGDEVRHNDDAVRAASEITASPERNTRSFPLAAKRQHYGQPR